ncbi:hypothetical protein [Streptomyces sp. NPDC050738]|uniref:hypothetical protein n=1 Tax=Streptomyces sp. NPDC050738 TaxID=3154744 RepID=UPI0034396E5D
MHELRTVGDGQVRGQARAWGFFAGWAAAGAGLMLALLTVLSIGVFVLPVAVALVVVLIRLKDSERGLPGLVSGVGAPLLYVAYLNRSGPGTVCTTSGTGQTCTEEWSPWPWLAAAVIVVGVGMAVMAMMQRRARG